MPAYRSPYHEAPGSALEILVGSLGGNLVVPFVYDRLYNLNRDGSNNIVQWADGIRGYGGTAPPVLVPTVLTNGTFVPPTYDATKGVVFSSTPNKTVLQGALSSLFGPSAGSVLGGITQQRLGTVWFIGEVDSVPSGTNTLAALVNGTAMGQGGATNDQVTLGVQGSTGSYMVWLTSIGTGATNANATNSQAVAPTTVADGTRRLIVMTVVTGNNHGIQIPTHSALTQSSLLEPTRTTEPYGLNIGPANGTSCPCSVAMVGGLTRSPSASDLTLLQNYAVTVHGATL